MHFFQKAGLTFLAILSTTTFAGGFQLWEQNVTNTQNFHAGRAALIPDASTAYDNPAGIPSIQVQEMVLGGNTVLTDIKFTGDVYTRTQGVGCVFSTQGSVQGGGFAIVPN